MPVKILKRKKISDFVAGRCTDSACKLTLPVSSQAVWDAFGWDMEEDIHLSQEMAPTSVPKGGLSPWHGRVAHGLAVISGLTHVQLWLGAPIWSPQPGAFFAAFLCSILLITVFHNCDSDFHS